MTRTGFTDAQIIGILRCLKALGGRIAARDPDRQTAEIHPHRTHEPLLSPRHG